MDSFHREEANEQDRYAVAIVKRTARHRTKVVGHMPKRISAACTLFPQQSGNIEGTTGINAILTIYHRAD